MCDSRIESASIFCWSTSGDESKEDLVHDDFFIGNKISNDKNVHYCEIKDFGLTSDNLGKNAIKVYKFNDVYSVVEGIFSENLFYKITSLLGVNPNFVNTEFQKYTIDKLPLLFKKKQSAQEASSLAIFCINEWDRNYQHFIIETLPRIWLAVQKFPNIPIVVYDTGFIREIVNFFFQSSTFIFLNSEDCLFFHQVYFIGPVSQNYGEITTLQIQTYRSILSIIREKLCTRTQIEQNVPALNNITYITRENCPENAGTNRFISNNQDFINELKKKFSLRTDYFENKSLAYKFIAVNIDNGKYITPIGANMMNFLFSYTNIIVFVITHPIVNNFSWFERLFKQINPGIKLINLDQTKLIECPDDKSMRNTPYLVRTEDIIQTIKESIQKTKLPLR